MNDEAVYRTAPATPGLLKICFPGVKTGVKASIPQVTEAGSPWREVVTERRSGVRLLYFDLPVKRPSASL